jgi:hypothetical protein
MSKPQINGWLVADGARSSQLRSQSRINEYGWTAAHHPWQPELLILEVPRGCAIHRGPW